MRCTHLCLLVKLGLHLIHQGNVRALVRFGRLCSGCKGLVFLGKSRLGVGQLFLELRLLRVEVVDFSAKIFALFLEFLAQAGLFEKILHNLGTPPLRLRLEFIRTGGGRIWSQRLFLSQSRERSLYRAKGGFAGFDFSVGCGFVFERDALGRDINAAGGGAVRGQLPVAGKDR